MKASRPAAHGARNEPPDPLANVSNGALWAAAAFAGILAGGGVLVWVSSSVQHHAAGMGAFGVAALAAITAAGVSVIGLVMCCFRRSRRSGGVLFAGGGMMSAVLLLWMASVVY